MGDAPPTKAELAEHQQQKGKYPTQEQYGTKRKADEADGGAAGE
eukprot:gene23594-66633_t